jgi:hypothetical protein
MTARRRAKRSLRRRNRLSLSAGTLSLVYHHAFRQKIRCVFLVMVGGVPDRIPEGFSRLGVDWVYYLLVCRQIKPNLTLHVNLNVRRNVFYLSHGTLLRHYRLFAIELKNGRGYECKCHAIMVNDSMNILGSVMCDPRWPSPTYKPCPLISGRLALRGNEPPTARSSQTRPTPPRPCHNRR